MIIRADARQLPLRDSCVQCCVTSPPYWGLRDYGTATWEGGDSGCDHLRVNDTRTDVKQVSNQGTNRLGYGDVCGKCGAHRIDNQIGLESTPDAYVASIVSVFAEVWRVLKADGTCWLNLGDSYASKPAGSNGYHDGRANREERTSAGVPPGLKSKDLVGIPWRVAFALQAAGWYLRSDIIWAKPNPMPESVKDRPTKSHEYLFLLTKSDRYYYNADAIAEPVSDAMLKQMEEGYDGLGLKDYGAAGVQNPSDVKARIIAGMRSKVQMQKGWNQDRNDGGVSDIAPRGLGRNKRTVWTINPKPYKGAHFATMPEALVEPCILAGSRLGDLVLDPFLGSGTVGKVAEANGRRWVGTDLSYQDLSTKRTEERSLLSAFPEAFTEL